MNVLRIPSSRNQLLFYVFLIAIIVMIFVSHLLMQSIEVVQPKSLRAQLNISVESIYASDEPNNSAPNIFISHKENMSVPNMVSYDEQNNLVRQIQFSDKENKTVTNLVTSDDYVTITRRPRILLWTPLRGSMKKWSWGMNSKSCLTWNCDVTENRREIRDIDVVVFSFQDLERIKMPTYRNADQIWAVFTREPPYIIRDHNRIQILNSYENKFNWTMTYNGKATVANTYGVYIRKEKPDSLNETLMMDLIKLKQYSVAWFVSHCNTRSNRSEYVTVLSQYISVHIYGKCGNLSCSQEEEDCVKKVENDYKFYLSFENALCEDYVTEKLFKILRIYTVPVVYGEANYSNIAPPHSYIDVRDYESPKALAEYLKYLENNPKEYMKYFEWKKDYEIKGNMVACNLCERLNKPFRRQYYKSFTRWWDPTMFCKDPPRIIQK